MSELETKLAETKTAILDKVTEYKSQTDGAIKDLRERDQRKGDLLEEIRKEIDVPVMGNRPSGNQKTIGELVVTQDTMDALRKYRKIAIDITDGLLHLPEQKATITTGTVGSSTAGIMVPDRIRDYVPGARRRLTIRDVLPARPCVGGVVEFPKESAFTNMTSPQVEGNEKDEAALTFTIGTANVRTFAHWIPATSQVLDDWPALQRIINETLLYGLKLKEEQQIVAGDGTGSYISGLTTEATAYAGTYNTANDTNLDRLRWAILELEDDDEVPDFILLNPKNFWTIMGLKTEDSGTANTGAYTVADPLAPDAVLTGYTFWGRKVVVSNSMTADSFLVGASAGAEIFDRQMATVVISTEHDTYFTKNLVAIRAEERIALAVYRSAFVFGAF